MTYFEIELIEKVLMFIFVIGMLAYDYKFQKKLEKWDKELRDNERKDN